MIEPRTRYQFENAWHRIQGYFFPDVSKNDRVNDFIRAKEELVRNLESDLEVVKSITYEEFDFVYLKTKMKGE
jgi:hypothetical protein